MKDASYVTKTRGGLALLAIATLLLSGCTANSSVPPSETEGPLSGTLKAVTNFGSSYYGLTLGLEMLKKDAPGVTVERVELTSGADSLTAVAAGQADVVTVGVTPLLLAREKGLEVKFGGMLNTAYSALVTMDPNIKSLKDFGPDDRIATVGTTSIGTFALLAAADRELGEYKSIQDKLQIMPHPDAVAALMNNQVAAHMATPPFLQADLANGAHEIIGGDNLLGTPLTFGCYALSEAYVKANPALYAALVDAVDRATQLINDDPEEAAKQIAAIDGVNKTEAEILVEIKDQGQTYSTKFVGYEPLASLMAKLGLVKSAPKLSDVSFPNVTGD